MTVNEKVAKIRELMNANNIQAYIIPSTDPHISEYVADCWTSRTWISGFNGSAGTVVITKDIAGLWTDSRYFLQAENQLAGSEFQLFKVGLPDVLDYPEWLNKNFSKGDRIGFDGKVFSVAFAQKLKSTFALKQIEMVREFDFISQIWEDRPEIPKHKIFVHELKYAGKSRVEKIQEIRTKMGDKGVDYHLLCSLDDINWTFNIRGYDVSYNPVAICYALISLDKAKLYIYDEKLTEAVKNELVGDGIEIHPYSDIEKDLANLPADSKILIDPARSNAWLYHAVPNNCVIVQGMNISTSLKSIKNETEINGIKNAMRRDCVALSKFLNWFEGALGKERITEVSVADKLRAFRANEDLFYGESFNTIAGYKGHGAIVHYSATKETDVELSKDGFFLLDSGGQYLDGTTDITRIFHLGEPTSQEKFDYTMVLKGHINLGMAKFPVNTRGSQLDVLARKFLWDNCMNYLHGTGHGVGCFMNVHEGPQNIRMDENPTVLEPGMITSNEPGLYRTEMYGIRIENLVLTVLDKKTDFGQFMGFETLTYFPIETKAIDKSLMTAEEIKWLNDYHQMVYNEVSPLMPANLIEWFKEKTKAI